MVDTSLSLLQRVGRSADTGAWNRLVDVYTPLLRGWLHAYQVQDADADDLVQEVLAVIAREIGNFDHNRRAGAFRNWLRTLLVHRLRDFWRRRDRRPAALGGTSMLERLDELEDENSRASRIWTQEHERLVVARLLEAIRPTFQPSTWQAFRRQFFEGHKPDRIAADLGMSLGAVYMARNRVLRALRREAAGLVESP